MIATDKRVACVHGTYKHKRLLHKGNYKSSTRNVIPFPHSNYIIIKDCLANDKYRKFKLFEMDMVETKLPLTWKTIRDQGSSYHFLRMFMYMTVNQMAFRLLVEQQMPF